MHLDSDGIVDTLFEGSQQKVKKSNEVAITAFGDASFAPREYHSITGAVIIDGEGGRGL